ncbi:excisionase family DNA-binding protein [Roseiconus lacunae]|uniref:excisionase family DNA-binding protein n=1 Tax=Roseiconus lacunae TaxID=2605694 RepID=UPI0030853FA2|nr:excisionase family DNA-binding protein [Stieleria sp. HD01]
MTSTFNDSRHFLVTREALMVTTSIPPAALPASEAAKYLGIPRSTFDRLAKDAPLPGIRMGNRKVFRVETLDRYLRQREANQVSA